VVVERSALARHRDRIGRVEEVVVEGPSRRDPTLLTGRTDQNKLVHFDPVEGCAVTSGSFANVAVSGAGRHHLSGRLLDVTARPSHRVLIPVTSG
jgi:tRNA-2-methylthio-N6-dimethylallyladenosine synthase